MYELLTGRPPFMSHDIVDLVDQVLSANPTRPSEISPNVSKDIEAICLTCLEKSPENRFDSAAQMAGELTRVLDGYSPQCMVNWPSGRTSEFKGVSSDIPTTSWLHSIANTHKRRTVEWLPIGLLLVISGSLGLYFTPKIDRQQSQGERPKVIEQDSKPSIESLRQILDTEALRCLASVEPELSSYEKAMQVVESASRVLQNSARTEMKKAFEDKLDRLSDSIKKVQMRLERVKNTHLSDAIKARIYGADLRCLAMIERLNKYRNVVDVPKPALPMVGNK